MPKTVNLIGAPTDVGASTRGAGMGPDALRHDTYSPSSITTTLGTTVKVTILNYDDMAHSFTAPDLGLNVIVQPAKDGQPTATTFTFTPTRTGKFRFFCAIPCDSDANGWAMKPDSGGPGQEGFMAGYVIVS